MRCIGNYILYCVLHEEIAYILEFGVYNLTRFGVYNHLTRFGVLISFSYIMMMLLSLILTLSALSNRLGDMKWLKGMTKGNKTGIHIM